MRVVRSGEGGEGGEDGGEGEGEGEGDGGNGDGVSLCLEKYENARNEKKLEFRKQIRFYIRKTKEPATYCT